MLNLSGPGMAGAAMLIKAIGINPDVIMQRANEFEMFARTFGIKVVEGIKTAETRLGNLEECSANQHEQLDRIETLLRCLVNQTAQISGAVTPAGDSWENTVFDYETPQVIAKVEEGKDTELLAKQFDELSEGK